jgi:hypothetical protein
MRQETIVRELLQFDELSEAAKEKARDWYREGLYNDSFEFEHVIDDAKTIGELMGIDIDKVYYTGFCSQGDGACFEGSYSYKKGSVKAVKEFAPLDTELHRIAIDLQAIQRRNFYQLTANVKQSGRGYHSNCTLVEVWKNDAQQNYAHDYASDDVELEVKELLKDYMNWIYKQLDKQNDYISSNEYIDEGIICNNYEFLESGRRA